MIYKTYFLGEYIIFLETICDDIMVKQVIVHLNNLLNHVEKFFEANEITGGRELGRAYFENWNLSFNAHAWLRQAE